MQLTATLEREELSDGTPIYVALCRELDIASQGETQSEAVMNLSEAVNLFLDSADDAEIGRRFRHALIMPEVSGASGWSPGTMVPPAREEVTA